MGNQEMGGNSGGFWAKVNSHELHEIIHTHLAFADLIEFTA